MVGTWSLVSMCYVAKMILDLEEDDWENWIRFSMWDKVIETLIGATSYHMHILMPHPFWQETVIFINLYCI